MCAFRFDDLEKDNTDAWPSIQDVFSTVQPKRRTRIVTEKTSPRSKAPNKTWVDHKNAESSRQAMLSARALKAWQTRRANGWVHPANR